MEKWKLVSEALPDIGKKVMVYCDPNGKNKNPLGVTTGHYWGTNENKTIHNGWDLTDITHWMELPEKPI